MADGFGGRPRLLKGALVNSNPLSVPPLVVPFQFNPEQLTRRRSARLRVSPAREGREEVSAPGEEMGEAQTTLTEPETISMDLRLDATDGMEAGDPVASRYGVLPALSALELMITPAAETFFAGVLGLSADPGFGTRSSIPVVIFVWGRQRVYPVRIVDLNIQEVEYNPNLAPSRVVVGVTLQVVGGANPFNRFTQIQRELLAAANLRNAPDLARSILL